MRSDNPFTVFRCGCISAILAFNLVVGGWSVNYLLEFFVNKTIPFWGAVAIGLFAGEISVPVAVVIAALKYFRIL